MNHGGDAAEQIVRMSLEGVEVAARITGTAAKEIALFLLAALKSPEKGDGKIKLKGKERLSSMLKSGKALEIFSVKDGDLKQFSQAAKQYGIVYCVLRNSKNCPDGLCDVMVKVDDAPKISRIIERFKFATVDKAKIESEIVADKADRSASTREGDTVGAESQATFAPEVPDINDTDTLVDDLLGTTDIPEPEKTEPRTPIKEVLDNRPLSDSPRNPASRRHVGDVPSPKSHPSEPISESKKKPERATLSKPSVKAELREITAARKAKEADVPRRDERLADDKANPAPAVTNHKQPQRGKSYKLKGIR